MSLMFGVVAADKCLLCEAAMDDKVAEVKRLLDAGMHPDTGTLLGSTP